MRSTHVGLLLGLCPFLFAVPASAWPLVDVTAVETLSLEPPLYRTSFAISFAGYNPGITHQLFTIHAQDPASLHLQDPVGPPGWSTGQCTAGDTGCLYFTSLEGGGAPVPAVLTGSIVSNASEPCVRIQFYDFLLSKAAGAKTDYDFAVEMCLVLDAPVPTQPTSWGSLKVQYR